MIGHQVMLFFTCIVLVYRICRVAGWCVQDQLTRGLLKSLSSGDMSKKSFKTLFQVCLSAIR